MAVLFFKEMWITKEGFVLFQQRCYENLQILQQDFFTLSWESNQTITPEKLINIQSVSELILTWNIDSTQDRLCCFLQFIPLTYVILWTRIVFTDSTGHAREWIQDITSLKASITASVMFHISWQQKLADIQLAQLLRGCQYWIYTRYKALITIAYCK